MRFAALLSALLLSAATLTAAQSNSSTQKPQVKPALPLIAQATPQAPGQVKPAIPPAPAPQLTELEQWKIRALSDEMQNLSLQMSQILAQVAQEHPGWTYRPDLQRFVPAFQPSSPTPPAAH
jgi:hypothetical protein